MADWDMTTICLVMMGCSIIAAGIIIAAMLLGYLHAFTPFLLITTIVLVVVSSVVILFFDQKSRNKA